MRAGRAHVVVTHQVLRELADVAKLQQRAARGRRITVRLEHDVRGDAESRRDPGAEAIFGDVCNAGGDGLPRITAREAAPSCAHRPLRRRAHARDRLRELALAVARDTGDGDDLAAANGE